MSLRPGLQPKRMCVSPMRVASLRPEHHDCVRQIAKAAEQDLDLDAEVRRPWARLHVAVEPGGGVPVAFSLIWAVADEFHVINVATHPAHRRKGAASALLAQLLADAKAHTARLVLLEVRRTNRAAIKLYRRHGFSIIGVRRGYYADTGEDALEMLLALDPETGQPLPGQDEVALELG